MINEQIMEFNTDLGVKICIDFCSYYTPEVILETDNITKQDEEFVRNCVYRQELLNLFDLDDYHEHQLQEKIDLLYEELHTQLDFEKILSKFTSSGMFCKETAFMVLFSFDFLHATQLCLFDYLENRKVKNENVDSLLKLAEEFFKNKSQLDTPLF
jgi:hypothetical protein